MQIEDDKILETLIEIKTQISEISANQRNFQSIITNHENRIFQLEHSDNGSSSKTTKDDDFKTEMLKLLGKCLLIGITAICSMAGAGGLLAKILGN